MWFIETNIRRHTVWSTLFVCSQDAEQKPMQSDAHYGHQVSPPSRSPVVLASDEREIVKVARLEASEHAMSQAQNKRLSDVANHQVEPVSPTESECFHVSALCCVGSVVMLSS